MCVLATKVEAFLGRGEGDYLMSHDMGDIIALVDGREELVDEVALEPQPLRAYLGDRLTEWLHDDPFTSLAVPGHIPPYASERAIMVLERLASIASPP